MTVSDDVGLQEQVHDKSLVIQQAIEQARFFLSLYKLKKLNESIE
jgi:hypothetical protein